jgi:hypothetical protein
MFTISFVNLDHALRLVKLMTIKKHMSGEGPIFTNHVDKARILKEKSCLMSCKINHQPVQIPRWMLLPSSI